MAIISGSMALSVSGFPEHPNADPSSESTSRSSGRQTQSHDVVKNRLRDRLSGPQSGLSKMGDSIIHTPFSHRSFYPTFDADLSFSTPISLVPQSNLIPAYVYAMTSDSEQNQHDSPQDSSSPPSRITTLGTSIPSSHGLPTATTELVVTSPIPSPIPGSSIPSLSSKSSTPNILTSIPTVDLSAPGKSPAASNSPSSPSTRPNITINTTGLWNSPTPASLQQPLVPQPHSLHPHSQRHPTSRVLISAPKRRNPNPPKGNINLRYQSMAVVDPSSSQASAKGDPIALSSMRRPSQSRSHRPKTSPGPRANTLEAIPNSWASASRPSDLRPVYPNHTQPQSQNAPRPVANQPPAQPAPAPNSQSARPKGVRSRSRSTDKNGGLASSRVIGPRGPRQTVLQLAQPTPSRLTLGMVMNTTKLVSASPPPMSILGPSISSISTLPKSAIVTSSVTKVLPIRSIPSSPTGSPSLPSHVPAIARLPISGSPDYKRETSPPPTSPPYRSAPFVPNSPFRAWTASPIQHIQHQHHHQSSNSPVSLPSSSPRSMPPVFCSAPIVPLSPFSPSPPSLPLSSTTSTPLSPRSPPAIAITSPTTASAGGTTSPVTPPGPEILDDHTGVAGAGIGDQELMTKNARRASSPDSPTSVLSYASVTIFSPGPGGGKRKSLIKETTTKDDTPHHTLLYPPYTSDNNFNQQPDGGDDSIRASPEPDYSYEPPTGLYEWTLEEQRYEDQLFRIPISPTLVPTRTSDRPEDDQEDGGDSSDPGMVEVFVDNVYYDEMERSPSPIFYARPRGSDDDSDEEAEFGSSTAAMRRRRRRLLGQQEADAKRRSCFGEEEKSQSESRDRDRAGDEIRPSRPSANGKRSGGVAGNPRKRYSNNKHGNYNGATGPSSPISYHSDDSSLFYYGTRPSRRRREQLRSYRHSYRPLVSPSSPSTAAMLPGPGPTNTNRLGTIESPRSPSPICYARRHSLDFLSDSDSDDVLDNNHLAVGGTNKPQHAGSGSVDGSPSIGFGWGSTRDPASAFGFFMAGLGDGIGGGSTSGPRGVGKTKSGNGGGDSDGKGKRGRRRTVQPRSFLHDYSKPPDLGALFGDDGNNAEERGERKDEKERGRKRERALIPMPLVSKEKEEKKEKEKKEEKEREKEKEKDKARTRKTSRTILDVAAAVAARNTISSRKPTIGGGGSSRSRSPQNKKEKEEKKRKWVWDLKSDNHKSERIGDSSTSGSTIGTTNNSVEGSIGDEVLDIGGGGSGIGFDDWSAEWDESPSGTRRKRKQRHSLAGLEFL